jgi:hypothetical protein
MYKDLVLFSSDTACRSARAKKKQKQWFCCVTIMSNRLIPSYSSCKHYAHALLKDCSAGLRHTFLTLPSLGAGLQVDWSQSVLEEDYRKACVLVGRNSRIHLEEMEMPHQHEEREALNFFADFAFAIRHAKLEPLMARMASHGAHVLTFFVFIHQSSVLPSPSFSFEPHE